MSSLHRTRRRGRLSFAAGLCLLAGGAAHAAGDGGGRFLLDTSGCPEVSPDAVRRLVAIEVGDLLREEADGPALDRLAIRCGGGAARVAAASASSARVVTRDLALRDFPGDAAPRALALAGLEALAALSPTVRARIETRHTPPRPAPAAVVSAPPAVPTTEYGRSVEWGVAVVRREFLATNGFAAWGGLVDVGWAIGARGRLAIDVELLRTETVVTRGEASALLGSLAVLAGLRAGGPRLTGILSLGARAGIVRLAGSPASGSALLGAAVYRPWAGPALSARALVGLGPLALSIFAEAGFAARGAEGLVEGETVIALAGGWLAGGAGVVF